jgi:hypothetical protein
MLLLRVIGVAALFDGPALVGSRRRHGRRRIEAGRGRPGCLARPLRLAAPAGTLLGELARRGDVLALDFHLGCWDGLGWKDPGMFRARDSIASATARPM